MKNARSDIWRKVVSAVLIAALVLQFNPGYAAAISDQVSGSAQAAASQDVDNHATSAATATDGSDGSANSNEDVSADSNQQSDESTAPDNESTESGTHDEGAGATGGLSEKSPSVLDTFVSLLRSNSTLDEVYLSTSGDDSQEGTADKPVKTLGRALELVKDGGYIHTAGSYTYEGDLSISKSVTFIGTDNFLTLQGGTLTASGSVSWVGYTTALTINSDATLGDGTYTFNQVNTGIDLKGSIKGTSRDALHVTVNANKNQVGINTTGKDLKYQKATITWNSGRVDGWTYRSLYMDDCTFYVKDVWLFSSASQPFNVQNSDLTIEGRFNQNSWRGGHVLSVYQDVPAYFTNSNVTVIGSRINVAGGQPLYITDSSLTVKDSPDGGININYGTSVYVENSTLKADNVSRGFVAAGADNASNLYVSGSSVIETAASAQADSVGVNGTYAVTGGTFKVYNGKLSDSNCVPTNGSEHGSEKLTLFTLADPSLTSLSLIDKNGQTYTYPVEKANADGSKNVWAPADTVTYTLNNSNARFADGTTADKSFTAMRGMTVTAATGYVNGSGTYVQNNFADPGTPTDVNGVEFYGWYYKDAQGNEHEYDPATTPVTAQMQVYAKWNAKTVVYHNGAGARHVVNLDPGDTTATALSFDEVAGTVDAFKRAGKTFSTWALAENGSNPVKAGDTLTFDKDQTQIDLYAQYTDNLYTVKFSANGGTFSEDSVFKNKDYFTIEKDAEGGDVAVLNKQATYGQTLHDVTEALGLKYADKSDAYLEVDAGAKLNGYKLASTEQWAQTPNARASIRFDSYKWWILTYEGENPTITSDVTYYLTWTTTASGDDNITDNGLTLDSDMWGASREESSKMGFVRPGETFSLTGMVNTQGIKDQMSEIEKQFGQTPSDFSNIALTRARSTFDVVLNVPQGVIVPANPQVSVNGLGDLFDVQETSVNGQQVTITMTLKDGIDNYQKLKDAVDSTGTQKAQPSLLRSLLALVRAPRAADTTSNEITATVSGLSLDADNVENGDILTAIGSVRGTFEATASIGDVSKFFSFTWSGKQTESGKDEASANSNAIQYSMEVIKPYKSSLPGDILIGKDTEHSQTYKVLSGESLDFTGALDMQPILDQMSEIESITNTGESSYPDISLKDTDCTFVATFTIPDGLSLPDNVTATAENFGDGFSIQSVEAEGNKVTVTMKLKDGITNYQELKAAVEAAGQGSGDENHRWMYVTIPGVKVSNEAKVGDKFTVVGTVSGTMKSTATLNSKTNYYEFEWSGTQWPEGADALTPDSQDITFTVEVPQAIEEELPGDMLVRSNASEAWDTQHEEVFSTKQGQTLDHAGALDVSKIKQQMLGIEQQFLNTDPQNIAVAISNFGFTATITLPEGITPPQDLSSADLATTENFGDGFEITDVEVDGQTVTVHFGLVDPARIDTYAKLKDVVQAAGKQDVTGSEGEWMRIVIPGVMVQKDAAIDTDLTATGSVAGTFAATATSKISGKRMVFSFGWNGTQWPEGSDSTLLAGDTNIQLTVSAAKADVPENPENPDTPDIPAPDEHAPEQPGADTPAAKEPRQEQLPKSGDTQLPASALALIGAAGAAAVATAVMYRKRKQK